MSLVLPVVNHVSPQRFIIRLQDAVRLQTDSTAAIFAKQPVFRAFTAAEVLRLFL
jgi:hypothetical protein